MMRATVAPLVLSALLCLVSAGRHGTTGLRAVRLEGGEGYGHPKCPCVGLDGLRGEVAVDLDATNGPAKVKFPASLGASCKAWESSSHPDCESGGDRDFTRDGTDPSWCKQAWCYVDPCNCALGGVTPKVSAYLEKSTYQGRTLYYTYETCGGTDMWTAKYHTKACVNQKTEEACGKLEKCAWGGGRCAGKDVMNRCEKPVDAAKFGAEDCRCVGIDNLDGTVRADLDPKTTLQYPADYGSTCQAWEQDLHPECKGDKAPKWCKQAWCFVDPCSCGQKEPPRVTTGLLGAEANFQGKQLFYSYSACGAEDLFTKGMNPKACVNQKTEVDCALQPFKCAWSGSRCLGKELVDTCPRKIDFPKIDMPTGLPTHSGAQALTPLAALAVLLAFRA